MSEDTLVETLLSAYVDSVQTEPKEPGFWIYKPESFEKPGKVLVTPWGAVGIFQKPIKGEGGRSVQPIRFEKSDFKGVFELH